jgi:hypothetical protein
MASSLRRTLVLLALLAATGIIIPFQQLAVWLLLISIFGAINFYG